MVMILKETKGERQGHKNHDPPNAICFRSIQMTKGKGKRAL
jgi:hypothetical protein